MANMLSEIYDALREAGASEEKARAAATAVASYESRFTRIETGLTVPKWMIGFNLAISLSILFKVFS